MRYYQRYYLNMDRYAFDKWLLSLVPDTVDVLAGKCFKIERENGFFTVYISSDGKRTAFKCRNVVGADGADSIVRKTFFKNQVFHYVSIQQWFKRTNQSVPFYSCIFDPETSESCSWLICKDDHVIYGGCFSVENCRAAFEKQKKRLTEFLGYDFGELEKTEACLANRPKRMRDFITGASGVYLIGESAGFISASSFEGISSAIISGNQLANAFLKCKDGKNVAGDYRRRTAKLRLKLYLKTKKRWFMYTPWVRNLIMKTGIDSIKLQLTE